MSQHTGSKTDFVALLHLLYEWPHYIEHLINRRPKHLLTPMHSRWMHYIWNAKEDVCLQAARLSLKTTSILIYGTVWWLLFHPESRIALMKKSFKDAARIVAAIKEAFHIPIIREVFKFAHGIYPDFRIKREGCLEFIFKKVITPEPSITALGIDTTVTGDHYDKIHCDDFINVDDRISKATRENTKERIREIRTNVIERGQPTAFIGTVWHNDDAWTILPPALKFDVYQVGMLTAEEIKRKQSQTTTSLFAANYLLQIVPDGGSLFTDPQYESWDYKQVNCYGHIDAAFGGSNTNGVTFFNSSFMDDKIHGIGKVFDGHIKNHLNVIVAEYRRLKCRGIYVEENADKGYTRDLLIDRGVAVHSYHEGMNKDYKISIYLYQRWKNIVWDKTHTDSEYLIQILDYMKGVELDDCPDSAASLIRAKFYNLKRVSVGALKGFRF